MRTWTAIFGIAVVIALLFLCKSEPVETPSNDNTATSTKTLMPGTPAQTRGTPSWTESPIARPALSVTGPVMLRREPMQPEEDHTGYQWRVEFVTAFDWFRAESKISEEKEREILRILGEAQEKLHAIEAEREPALEAGGKQWESYLHWASILTTEVASEAEEEVSALLTPQERQARKRYMAMLVWGVHLQYAEPLRMEPSAAG